MQDDSVRRSSEDTADPSAPEQCLPESLAVLATCPPPSSAAARAPGRDDSDCRARIDTIVTGRPRIRRVGILGHVGNKNLGDEAIIAAVIQGVRRRCADAQICGFTINPDDTAERHHIAAYPIRRRHATRPRSISAMTASQRPLGSTQRVRAALKRVPILHGALTFIRDAARVVRDAVAEVAFLARCYRVLKGADLMIVAGSQQLSDYFGGPWAFPFTLFKWSLIARATRTKVAFLSVGAGPIASRLSRRLLRSALAAASYRSYRDAGSRRLIADIGGPHDPVVPDLVLGLEPAIGMPRPRRAAASLLVGINPMPFADPRFWPEADSSRYRHYVRTLAAFSLWLIEGGQDVLFYPTHLRADPPVITDIWTDLKSIGPVGFERRIVDRQIDSFEDLMSALAATDIVVPTRFHGIVLPLLLHKPVLGIAYHPKTYDLMAQMGQSDYVVDVDRLDLTTLKDRFNALEAHKEQCAAQIAVQTAACRASLDVQYDAVAALLNDAERSGRRSPLTARAVSDVLPPCVPATRDDRAARKSTPGAGRPS